MSDVPTVVDAHAGDDLSSLAGDWEVDPTHSALEFVARYAMFTRVRGRFTSFSGTVVIDPLHPETTQIAVDIDASSVDSAMPLRDSHLRGVIRTSRSDPVLPRCSALDATRYRGS
jgi:polyisoprenoid-binding protein YceI